MRRFRFLLPHLALALGLGAQALAAKGSFTDVPRSHWAHGAIQQLQTAGLIKGRGGKFQGGRSFTRYEMAVVLARYLEKLQVAKGSVQQAVNKTYPLIKKLATEFSEELDLLGVKHQDLLARVTSLETRADGQRQQIEELRALIEENRRQLARLQGGAGDLRPVMHEAPRPPPRRELAAAPSYPAPSFRPRPAAPLPPPTQARSYPAPAPVAGPSDLFQPTQAGDLEVPDALRLQNLRMRARSLLDGGSPSGPPPRIAPTRPAPRRTVLGSQAQAPVTEEQLLRTIDEVRAGQLDPGQARAVGDRFARSHPSRRPGRSVVYPLTERLFGPTGFGPPASD